MQQEQNNESNYDYTKYKVHMKVKKPVKLMEGRDREASPQPPVPQHTQVLVPAKVRGLYGWHMC